MLVTISESMAKGIVKWLVAPIMVGCDLRVEVMSLRTCRHRELVVIRAVCTANVAELPIVLDTMWVLVNILCGIGLLPTPSRLSAVALDSSLLLIGIALFGNITSMLFSRIRLIGIALNWRVVVVVGVEFICWKLLDELFPLVVNLCFMLGRPMMRVARGVVLTSVARSCLVPVRVHLLTVLLDATTSAIV